MKIEVNEDREIVLSELFNAIGIKTQDDGEFGISERNGGLEIMKDGVIVWRSLHGMAGLIQVFQDGDQWCAMVGENLQEGEAAFGGTPATALDNFSNNADCMARLFNTAPAKRKEMQEDGEATGIGKLHEWITNNIPSDNIKAGEDPVDTAIRIMGDYLDSHGARKQ